MPGPTISERYKYLTLPQAAQRLGIHQAKLRRRLKDGIFPAPTHINEYGLSFFDEGWLRQAQVILANSFEAKVQQQGTKEVRKVANKNKDTKV